jgi:hypothetical protein
MKRKINLVGNSFTHLTGGNKGYSVHGKESKFIEWVNDNSLQETFYVDGWIPNALKDDISGVKYGWLLESKEVTPDVVLDVKNRHKEYFKVFKYIFTHNKELLDLDDRFKWCPANGYWIKKAKLYPKSKVISFVTSNKNFTEGHRKRLEWVEKIGDQVDLFGRGFNEIENKEDALCDYMFSVVIENGFYKSYFTEKILDCFAAGTIPVYLGTPDIGEYFNQDGILNLTEEFDVSEEIYYSKMNAIKENLEKVKSMEVIEDFIYQTYLKNDIIQ